MTQDAAPVLGVVLAIGATVGLTRASVLLQSTIESTRCCGLPGRRVRNGSRSAASRARKSWRSCRPICANRWPALARLPATVSKCAGTIASCWNRPCVEVVFVTIGRYIFSATSTCRPGTHRSACGSTVSTPSPLPLTASTPSRERDEERHSTAMGDDRRRRELEERTRGREEAIPPSLSLERRAASGVAKGDPRHLRCGAASAHGCRRCRDSRA